MKTFNTQFKNNAQLLTFIQKHNISCGKNILIQIFSSLIDKEKLLSVASTLQTHLPQANIIGVTTGGEIMDGKIYDNTVLISFSIFESTTIRSQLFDFEEEFDITDISDSLITNETKALIIFSDGLKSNAENLLDKLAKIAPDIIISGGRAADIKAYATTFVFNSKNSTENGVVVASLSSNDLIVNSDYILHWNKIGKEMKVTKADGDIVYEIDNIKIKNLYAKYLGSIAIEDIPSSLTEFPLLTTRNGVEVARSPIAILEDDSFLFAGNLKVGEKVAFAYGDINDIKNSLKDNSVKLSQIPIESIFIYSCLGRKTLMGKELESEFQMLNSFATTAGFFTFGEFYHSNSVNELLNITTTFLSLSENSQQPKKKAYIENKSVDNRVLKVLTHLAEVTSNELESKNKELSKLNNILSDKILYTTSDLDGNIMSISRAYLRFLNLSEKDVIGKNHNIFKHPDTKKSFYVDMWDQLINSGKFVGELKNKHTNGSEYWVKLEIDSIYDDKGIKSGYSAFMQDITDKKLLEYVAIHDPLTKLYNRVEFVNHIQAQIKSAQRYGEHFGFIICDIDYFKKINDTYGHQVGDEVLVKISTCLKLSIRDDDFLARWGGEEFIIIAKHATVNNLIPLVQKLQVALSKVSFSPVPKVTMSFGLTTYVDGDTKDTLLERADKALYQAKNNGRDRYEMITLES